MSEDKVLNCYYPGKKFPAISITGNLCQLNCGHCGSHYLESMTPATDPSVLLELSMKLWKEGALGILVSGGCDESGRIQLEPFYKTLAKIKSETGLIINLHTGLLNDNEIVQLAESGIDIVSFDLVIDPAVIRDVYHLNCQPQDYIDCFEKLKNAGINVVPHICIGLSTEGIQGELQAVKMLKSYPPDRLVFIIFIPTKGTQLENKKPPAVEAVREVISTASKQLPNTELVLGCMRPRRPERYELTAVEAGISGLVLPSNKTVKMLKEQGWEINKMELCCAVIP